LFAASYGLKDLAQRLIAEGIDINEKISDTTIPYIELKSDTPLLRALQRGSVVVARLLIDKGADVNKQNDNGEVPLLIALAKLRIYGYREQNISKRGFYLDPFMYEQNEPLDASQYAAICKAYRDIVKRLVLRGAELNKKDEFGDTALHYSARDGEKELAELFIYHGADVNSRNEHDLTPLHYAARNSKEVTELLLSNGADINAMDRDGDTPLHDASRLGRLDIVELLVESGADIQAINRFGRTPLEGAERRGRQEIVEFLQKHGAKE
jgi:ankyrin repeat protein